MNIQIYIESIKVTTYVEAALRLDGVITTAAAVGSVRLLGNQRRKR